MNGATSLRALCAGLLFFLSSPLSLSNLSCQVNRSASGDGTAEDVVRELYDLVTFPAGTTPDWDQGRALFVPEGVVILRTSPTATTVFSVEGWVQDFVKFFEDAKLLETGFTERIVRIHATEFGDMAHVWVLYEAEIPGWDRPPQAGVDSFQLAKRDGEWLIASILNEIPTPERPLPDVLREGG